MKKTSLLFALILAINIVYSQNLKPYILGVESSESVASIKASVVKNLQASGIKILGQYQPASDANRWVIVFSSVELENAVKKHGGLTGFAATLRMGITREGGKSLITYTNPPYWGNAYFRDNYESVSQNYATLNGKLEKAMRATGSFVGSQFGSEKGVEVDDLRKYHYMMGMPYFDDTEELEEFESHKEALDKIESNLAKGVPNVKLVYKVIIPGKDLVLYGFALSGEDGEAKFMPTIDIGQPKHTAFLPYEVLVKGNEVHMLHGRFRIALSFPDLTMGTFSKIMSTPGDIEDMLEQLVE